MKFELQFDFVGHVEHPFVVEALEKLAAAALATSRVGDSLTSKKVILSAAMVSGEEIARVNQEFRGKEGVTDVISIGEYADNVDVVAEKAQTIDLGELLFCWEFIQNSATILDEEPAYEFAYVFVHGVLHLVGYDHGEEMYALQDQLAEAYFDSLLL